MGYTVIKDGHRPCISCTAMLPLVDFMSYSYTTKQGKPSARYNSRCRACEANRRADRYERRKHIELGQNKRWIEANRERVKARAAERQQTAKTRAMKAAHQRERNQRLKAGGGPKDPAVGALYLEARLLEEKIRACVASDSDLDLQVHVDHIVPLSRGGLHTLSNLRIVSGRHNLEKGASLE